MFREGISAYLPKNKSYYRWSVLASFVSPTVIHEIIEAVPNELNYNVILDLGHITFINVVSMFIGLP